MWHCAKTTKDFHHFWDQVPINCGTLLQCALNGQKINIFQPDVYIPTRIFVCSSQNICIYQPECLYIPARISVYSSQNMKMMLFKMCALGALLVLYLLLLCASSLSYVLWRARQVYLLLSDPFTLCLPSKTPLFHPA